MIFLIIWMFPICIIHHLCFNALYKTLTKRDIEYKMVDYLSSTYSKDEFINHIFTIFLIHCPLINIITLYKVIIFIKSYDDE